MSIVNILRSVIMTKEEVLELYKKQAQEELNRRTATTIYHTQLTAWVLIAKAYFNVHECDAVLFTFEELRQSSNINVSVTVTPEGILIEKVTVN